MCVCVCVCVRKMMILVHVGHLIHVKVTHHPPCVRSICSVVSRVVDRTHTYGHVLLCGWECMEGHSMTRSHDTKDKDKTWLRKSASHPPLGLSLPPPSPRLDHARRLTLATTPLLTDITRKPQRNHVHCTSARDERGRRPPTRKAQ